MATTTMGSTKFSGWTADRTVYWAIGIALAIIAAIAFTRDRMANNSATAVPATYESGYESGAVVVPSTTNMLESSVVNDPTVAPVNPNVDTSTSGSIRTAPMYNQRAVPSIYDTVVDRSVMPRATPTLENEANTNSRMNRANGAYSLDAQDRVRGSGTSRQQFTDDTVLGTNGTKSTGTSTGNTLSNPGTSTNSNSNP